jgi:formylglycine-generating enzyme required for sulfatase activity
MDTKTKIATAIAIGALSGTAVAGPPGGPLQGCPRDAVVSGPTCIDKYEASVWRVPNATTTNKGLVRKIQKGKASVARLTAAGAMLLGASGSYAPCADSGQNCASDVYAASLPGVMPSANLTWFQAQAACRNAGKRLPTNAEWQAAVAGTPDPGPDDGVTDCNTSTSGSAVLTGSRRRCVSARGAFDMVGNLSEWVAEWVPRSTACGAWSTDASTTGDFQCLAGAATSGEPGALLRGGGFLNGSDAGPFYIAGYIEPSTADSVFGFRCIR